MSPIIIDWKGIHEVETNKVPIRHVQDRYLSPSHAYDKNRTSLSSRPDIGQLVVSDIRFPEACEAKT